MCFSTLFKLLILMLQVLDLIEILVTVTMRFPDLLLVNFCFVLEFAYLFLFEKKLLLKLIKLLFRFGVLGIKLFLMQGDSLLFFKG